MRNNFTLKPPYSLATSKNVFKYEKKDVSKYFFTVHVKDNTKFVTIFRCKDIEECLKMAEPFSREIIEIYELWSSQPPTEQEYKDIFGMSPFCISWKGNPVFDWVKIEEFTIDGKPEPTKRSSNV